MGIFQSLNREYPRSPLSTLSALTRQPHFPIGSVLLMHMAALKYLGIVDPLEQALGHGSFGEAFRVNLGGRKSVIKLTRDPTEAEVSSLLTGRPMRKIVPIHSVWALEGTHREGLRGWYCVHRAYLEPLSKRDAGLVDVIFDVYNDEELALSLPRQNQRGVMDSWRNYLRNVLDNEYGEGGSGPMMQRVMFLLKEIAEAVHEMHAQGVDWEDIHSGNLMRDKNGSLTIADVGWGIPHVDVQLEIPFLTPEMARKYAISVRGN